MNVMQILFTIIPMALLCTATHFYIQSSRRINQHILNQELFNKSIHQDLRNTQFTTNRKFYYIENLLNKGFKIDLKDCMFDINGFINEDAEQKIIEWIESLKSNKKE